MADPHNLSAAETRPGWREVLQLVLPKEHGSWSLALEPVALGLIVAPTLAGACLAVAVIAGFFARRPLRIAVQDTKQARQAAGWRAVCGCAAVAAGAMGGTLGWAGTGWLMWLTPAIAGGVVFLAFDLQKSNRETVAELAGCAAFAWLPAVFVVLGGGSHMAAVALAIAMLVRAVPTILCVRTVVRARKTGVEPSRWPVLVAAGAAAVAFVLAQEGHAPWTLLVLALLLAARAFGLLVYPRPPLRARTLGMIELGLGVVYVVGCGVAWRLGF